MAETKRLSELKPGEKGGVVKVGRRLPTAGFLDMGVIPNAEIEMERGRQLVPMTLAQLSLGKTATIVEIEGGRGLRQKLLLIGLFEGKAVRVVSNYGPIIVEVDRSLVAIGYGMAQKIQVERC